MGGTALEDRTRGVMVVDVALANVEVSTGQSD
jgi:hypothetical protein